MGIFKSDRVSGSKTRQIMLAVFAGLAVALGSIFAPAPVQASETTENFVRESITRGLEILNSTAFSEEERSAEFRRYMLSLTDARRIASFTLGQYANRASPAEFDAFVEAYTEFALALYAEHLSQHTGQILNVMGSVDRSADDSLVSAELSNPTVPDTPIINVAFRVRSDTDCNPILLDMQIECIWLVINRRADFISYLQQHGGSVSELTAYLWEQTRQIRAKPNDAT